MIDSAVATVNMDTALPATTGSRAVWVICGGVALALSLGHPLIAQSGANSRPAIVQPPYPGELGHPNPDRDTPSMDQNMLRRRLRALNVERQKSMISDRKSVV